jgi:Zn-finger nucleic acid-binding protein
MNMRDEMRELGYSKEDEYFHRKDQELIQHMREAANARKQQLEEQHKGQAYWMTCPKCGTRLEERILEGVVHIDACGSCEGQFFDKGELELLLKARTSAALRGGA